MSHFAKIINLDKNAQVLLTLGYNTEDQTHEVEVRTVIKGIFAAIKHGFHEEAKAKQMLKNYSLENAKLFRESIKETLFN